MQDGDSFQKLTKSSLCFIAKQNSSLSMAVTVAFQMSTEEITADGQLNMASLMMIWDHKRPRISGYRSRLLDLKPKGGFAVKVFRARPQIVSRNDEVKPMVTGICIPIDPGSSPASSKRLKRTGMITSTRLAASTDKTTQLDAREFQTSRVVPEDRAWLLKVTCWSAFISAVGTKKKKEC